MPRTNDACEKQVKIHWHRFVIWAVVLVAAALFLMRIYHTLTIFGLGMLIAYLLSPAVRFFSRLNIPFTQKKLTWFTSIIIVYILLFTFLIIGSTILIPMVIDQINHIVRDTPILVGKVQESLLQIQSGYERLNIPADVEAKLMEFTNSSIAKVGDALGMVFKSVGKVLLGIISWVLFVIFALIIAMFVLFNVDDIKRQFYSYIPPDYQDDIKDLLTEINNIFGAYVRGYSVLCFVNGLFTYIMLMLVPYILRLLPNAGAGFPVFGYSLVVSVVAGITYFIPYLGCSITVVIAMALAFFQLPSFAYVIVLGFTALLTNQFVDRFITPKILGDALGVSTLFIVFAAFAGGELLGVWGMIIGIPSAVMIQSIMRFVYNRFLAFPVSEEILASQEPKPKVTSDKDTFKWLNDFKSKLKERTKAVNYYIADEKASPDETSEKEYNQNPVSKDVLIYNDEEKQKIENMEEDKAKDQTKQMPPSEEK